MKHHLLSTGLRRRCPSPALIIALIALFIALGGGAYAAITLPANSVGTKQLKNRAVTKKKISKKTLKALKGRRGPRGATGPQGPRGATGPTGPPGPATGPAGGDLTGNYPNPTIAAGAVTSSKIAAGAVGVSKIGVVPAVRANTQPLTLQSIPSGSVTDVNFDNETFDTASLHSNTTNNWRVTAPVAGVYQLTADVRWESNNTGTRFVDISTNTAGRIASVWQTAAQLVPTDQSVSAVYTLAAGDYAFLEVYQTSGGALQLQKAGTDAPSLTMTWVGPTTTGAPATPTRGTGDTNP